jgi:hypothetical protein
VGANYCNRCRKRACGSALHVLLPLLQSRRNAGHRGGARIRRKKRQVSRRKRVDCVTQR